MKIEHLAIWVKDLEKMKDFYVEYFSLKCNEKYFNPAKIFSSYFLSFKEGCRIELMHNPEIANLNNGVNDLSEKLGLTHFAISVGSKEKVNSITERLRKDGYQVLGEPRTTGDGYYESVIVDPENNRIEITV